MKWTPHPVMPILSDAEQLSLVERLGEDEAARVVYDAWNAREEAITLEKEDPYRNGWEPDHWATADRELRTHGEILVMGGNRAGKSEWAAKRVVQSLVENPGTIIWCLTETSANSIQFQQKFVYKYLPKEYKHLGRGKVGYCVYSLRNGFTSAKFSLPNRSECIFRNWSQDIATIEGGEIGSPGQEPEGDTFNVGFWADELIPLSWLQTLRYRCLTRADADGLPARGIVTFTAVDGWNAVVRSLMTGAKTIESRPAELLGGEEVPVVMQPVKKTSSVVFFHTADNPYGGWDAMKTQLEGERRDVVLCRAYGVPTKASKTVFPQLSDKNYARPEDIPILTDPASNPARWVMVIDPAGSKPWFMILVGIDAHGVHWVVKEWPSADMGEWVDLTRGEKGRARDAQAPNGYGIKDYAEAIRMMEGSREGVERIIDPRLGTASYQKAEGASNIVDDLTYEEELEVYPAVALDVEAGVQAINSLLSWDATEEMDYSNRPRLMFSDDCQNTIVCMNEWIADGDMKSPSKDPVDCVRYLAVGNYQWYDESAMREVATGGY